MEFDLRFAVISTLLALMSTILYWYYRNFIAAYSQLPSYRLDLRVLYWLLMRQYPKHMKFSTFFFQKLCAVFKQHESEDICLVWFIEPFVAVFSEEYIKAFSFEPSALDKPRLFRVFEEIVGKGLFTSNGDRWKEHRKMLNPEFHLRIMKNHVPVLNKHASILVEKLTKVVEEPSIEMASFLKPCILNIISEIIAGLDIEENAADINEIYEIFEKAFNAVAYRIVHPYLHWNFLLKFFPDGRKYIKFCEMLNSCPRRIVMREIKSQTIPNTEKKFEGKDSECSVRVQKPLIQKLVEFHLKNPSFTFQDILDELKTFIGAGYDTAATSLIWCVFTLSSYPDVQEQVYNEIQSLGNKDLTYDDLNELTYLDCVIKETLRLYPVAPIYGRRLNKAVKCGKYNFPKDTNIVFCPFTYHRNPHIYPDPERFDPDRFKEGTLNKRAWTYIPFAEGNRNCIGKKFALLELKVILVHMLRKFKITALDRIEDVEFEWEGILKTSKPLHMKLSLRQ